MAEPQITAPPAAPAPDSLQARLRAARAAKQAQSTREIPIPGYRHNGIELVGVFKSLSWEQTKAAERQSEAVSDKSDQELYIAADSLAAACVKTVAIIDGERHDLPPLGVELATWLDDTIQPENARQAVFLIFGDEVRVILAFSRYMEWRADMDLGIDRGLSQGN